MELINYILFIFLVIKLWQYSFLTIFSFMVVIHILEYIGNNGSYIKYRLVNTQSFPGKIIYGCVYGINLIITSIINIKNYFTNKIIETKLGNFFYLKLNKINLKFLELKYNIFYYLTNKLIKIIMLYFDTENQINKNPTKEVKKLEEKKPIKKILESDEEINNFLNEIIESMND